MSCIRIFYRQNAGVPRGSVSLNYVNDVAENMLSICRLFADDNSLQQSSCNVLYIDYKLIIIY